MNIEITNFEENDREQLRQIYMEVRQTNFNWLEKESFNSSSFDKDTEGEFILVAKSNSKIVGFASIWLKDNFLHHLYIQNHFQRKGIGTKLLDRAIEFSNSEITLKCLKKNKIAVKFYLKNGWKPLSEGTSDEGAYVLFKYPV